MTDSFLNLIENLDTQMEMLETDTEPAPQNLFYGLPMEQYLGHPAIGSSMLKKIIAENPAEFLAARDTKNKDTKSTVLGTAIHTAILEPGRFLDLYALQPEDWGPRNKGDGYQKWNHFKEHNGAKTCLGFEEAETIRKVLDSSLRHRSLKTILANCRTEVTAIVSYDGYAYKARADVLTEDGFIWDVKSSSGGLDQEEIQKTIYSYGYHFQMAHHTKVFVDAGVPIKGFGWIFISTQSAAVHIVTRLASPQLLKAGQADHAYATERLEECLRTGLWPGYDDDVMEIGLPAFAERFYEE